MRHIKLPIKQIVSYFVAVIMVVVLILVVNVKTEASIVQPYWDGWNKLINEGNRTLNGGNFIVTENITINSNSNGLIIKGSVTIYIADGTTLSINPYSEYNNNILNNPGILIQTGSRLIIRGNGTLNTNAIIGTFTSPPTNQGTLIILDNVTVNENNRQQNPNTLVFTGNGATLLPQDTYRKIIESNIITFCANGGSLGSVPVAIYNHDGFITQLPIAIPEFEHYEFLRWNTQPDGSGSDYYYGHIIPANDTCLPK